MVNTRKRTYDKVEPGKEQQQDTPANATLVDGPRKKQRKEVSRKRSFDESEAGKEQKEAATENAVQAQESVQAQEEVTSAPAPKRRRKQPDPAQPLRRSTRVTTRKYVIPKPKERKRRAKVTIPAVEEATTTETAATATAEVTNNNIATETPATAINIATENATEEVSVINSAMENPATATTEGTVTNSATENPKVTPANEEIANINQSDAQSDAQAHTQSPVQPPAQSPAQSPAAEYFAVHNTVSTNNDNPIEVPSRGSTRGRPRGRGRARGTAAGRGAGSVAVAGRGVASGRVTKGRARGKGRGRGRARGRGRGKGRGGSLQAIPEEDESTPADPPLSEETKRKIERQELLASQYRTLAGALQPALLELANRTEQQLRTDRRAHKKTDNYEKTVEGLKDRMEPEIERIQRHYQQRRDANKEVYEASRKAVEAEFGGRVGDLQELWSAKGRSRQMGLARAGHQEEDGEATDDEVRLE
ncbi:MAG: hypothetical protein M1823_004139 [Watsoniomyces obsoletus]|nr:MAG: hypothetical protein M1823_004139 [Watsoniomyces obsoletus]